MWDELYRSMAERWRPEDVACLGAQLLPHLKPALNPALRSAYYGTPNMDRYGRPGFRGHSVDTSITARYPGLPFEPRAAVALLTQYTGLYSNDLRDRLPAPLRKAAGITISRRQFMRQCRILQALRRKLDRVAERGKFSRWERVAQSGWALDIKVGEFMAMSPETRVFVAYYVARRQRQSVFSGSGQNPAWDTVSARLFELVVPSFAVARAFPNEVVLSRITDTDRAVLMVNAYSELRQMALTMSLMWDLLGANRDTMVVRRGMNSSDWNAVAGAWNAVRSAWISLIYACGMERNLDHFCPGKAMRLMAADVSYWHRAEGGDEGPDVKIFKQLPLPWDVVLGKAACGRANVRDAILAAGVDRDNWTVAYALGRPVATKVTAALVHGVAISDPALADLLRRAGWFSGKGGSAVDVAVEVERTKDGFAKGVSSATERSAR